MTFSHRIARKRGEGGSYDMDYFTFEYSVTDMPDELRTSISQAEAWSLMLYVGQRNLIQAELTSGHIGLDNATARIDYLRSCLGHLAEKVVKYGL